MKEREWDGEWENGNERGIEWERVREWDYLAELFSFLVRALEVTECLFYRTPLFDVSMSLCPSLRTNTHYIYWWKCQLHCIKACGNVEHIFVGIFVKYNVTYSLLSKFDYYYYLACELSFPGAITIVFCNMQGGVVNPTTSLYIFWWV